MTIRSASFAASEVERLHLEQSQQRDDRFIAGYQANAGTVVFIKLTSMQSYLIFAVRNVEVRKDALRFQPH